MGEAQIIEEQPRELCPNLTDSKDLINRIGALSVDILNKEKVLFQLWEKIDDLTINLNLLNEEVVAVKKIRDDQEVSLKSQSTQLETLHTEKQSIEKALRDDISTIKNNKDAEILELKNTLNSLQKKANEDLIEARSEIYSLKTINESINKKTPKGKKKKTNAKPARA